MISQKIRTVLLLDVRRTANHVRQEFDVGQVSLWARGKSSVRAKDDFDILNRCQQLPSFQWCVVSEDHQNLQILRQEVTCLTVEHVIIKLIHENPNFRDFQLLESES